MLAVVIKPSQIARNILRTPTIDTRIECYYRNVQPLNPPS